MSRLLDEEEISRQLEELPGWLGDGNSLTREMLAASFPDAIQIVDDITEVAEEMDHHPDIDIR